MTASTPRDEKVELRVLLESGEPVELHKKLFSAAMNEIKIRASIDRWVNPLQRSEFAQIVIPEMKGFTAEYLKLLKSINLNLAVPEYKDRLTLTDQAQSEVNQYLAQLFIFAYRFLLDKQGNLRQEFIKAFPGLLGEHGTLKDEEMVKRLGITEADSKELVKKHAVIGLVGLCLMLAHTKELAHEFNEWGIQIQGSKADIDFTNRFPDHAMAGLGTNLKLALDHFLNHNKGELGNKYIALIKLLPPELNKDRFNGIINSPLFIACKTLDEYSKYSQLCKTYEDHIKYAALIKFIPPESKDFERILKSPLFLKCKTFEEYFQKRMLSNFEIVKEFLGQLTFSSRIKPIVDESIEKLRREFHKLEKGFPIDVGIVKGEIKNLMEITKNKQLNEMLGDLQWMCTVITNLKIPQVNLSKISNFTDLLKADFKGVEEIRKVIKAAVEMKAAAEIKASVQDEKSVPKWQRELYRAFDGMTISCFDCFMKPDEAKFANFWTLALQSGGINQFRETPFDKMIDKLIFTNYDLLFTPDGKIKPEILKIIDPEKKLPDNDKAANEALLFSLTHLLLPPINISLTHDQEVRINQRIQFRMERRISEIYHELQTPLSPASQVSPQLPGLDISTPRSPSSPDSSTSDISSPVSRGGLDTPRSPSSTSSTPLSRVLSPRSPESQDAASRAAQSSSDSDSPKKRR